MDKANLTFAVLNERIDALPEHESLAVAPTRRQRLGLIIAFGAGFLCVLAVKVLPASFPLAIFSFAMLAIEIVALVMAVPRRPWVLPSFAAGRREFADLMDFDLHEYEKLITWLRGFPKDRLDAMARFATHRNERLRERYPLVFGGIEKLGTLPVVTALFLQFKDLQWPPHMTWIEFILGTALVGLYWAGLAFTSVRYRAQLFEMLLKRAIETEDALGAKQYDEKTA
jgi:hypothetical protein